MADMGLSNKRIISLKLHTKLILFKFNFYAHLLGNSSLTLWNFGFSTTEMDFYKEIAMTELVIKRYKSDPQSTYWQSLVSLTISSTCRLILNVTLMIITERNHTCTDGWQLNTVDTWVLHFQHLLTNWQGTTVIWPEKTCISCG